MWSYGAASIFTREKKYIQTYWYPLILLDETVMRTCPTK